MFEFFDWIIALFTNLWTVVSNGLSSLIVLLDVLLSIQFVPSHYYPLVPSFLGSCIFIVSFVGIAKLLVGWGNS